jgi:hypothetical protein
MNYQRLAATLLVCVLAPRLAAGADGWTNESFLHRVFLDDGTSLASYGEPARLGDRVVFSMPTAASPAEPHLHLVTIPANRVDWNRTNSYAESVRAAQYIATRAESHYSMLTAEITQALNDVGLTTEPKRRLEIAERVRRTLADWPGRHYGYKQDEIQKMLAMLDEAIADLRAAAGVERFDLSFVAAADASPTREPLLPPNGPKEVVEQTLTAARLTDMPAERMSLLSVALATIDREADKLSGEWRTEVRASAATALDDELRIERQYSQLQARMLMVAAERAKSADVRGVEAVAASIRERDKELGSRRPDAVASLLSAVSVELDAARRLRLERDRWALRWPELQKYQAAFLERLKHLESLKGSLEDIKALSGSAPQALGVIEQTAAEIVKGMSSLKAPEEFRAAHELMVSAASLAANAARIRREAALDANLTRAWDASSAAAGAIMMSTRARIEIQTLLRLPLFRR